MGQAVQIGQLLAGKYVVEEVIGEGGMGLVLAARHRQLGQKVAVKIMLPRATELFPDAAERFLGEARALVRLTSAHVARVIDVGSLDVNTPYLVMEYLDGIDLGELLKRAGPIAVEDAVDYVIQACVAMAEAHRQGIIHRDLKPGNLFLTQRHGKPLIKVLDFGISKVADLSAHAPTVTQTWGSMGSPPYMSPEQSKSAKYVDERSDVWSLGAILYQLLSGRLPFPGEAAPEIFANIMYRPPEPLREAAPWVPEPLEAILLRCLSKKPEARVQSMHELAEALAPFASPAGRALAEDAFEFEEITAFLPADEEGSLPTIIVKGPTSRHGTPIPRDDPEARSHASEVRAPARRRGLVLATGLLFAIGVGAGAFLFDWTGQLGGRPLEGPPTSPRLEPGATGAADRAPAVTPDAGAAREPDARPLSDAAAAAADASPGPVDAAPRADAPRAKPRTRTKRRRKPPPKAADPFGSIGEPVR